MIESAFPIVEVPDMRKALEFYRDCLGGQVVYTYPPQGDDLFYASLQTGSTQIGLGLTEGGTAGADAGMLLWFYVDDVRATTAALAEAGVEVLEEPNDTDWGERVSMVADPFGTRVRLGQQLHPQPEEE